MAFAAYKSIKLCPGLSLEERVGAAHYKAVARINGKVYPYNTETNDFIRAERHALSWFKRLQATVEGEAKSVQPREFHTVGEAAKRMLADMPPSLTKDFYEQKWNAGLRQFFGNMDIDAVDTPTIKEFTRWRKQRAAENGTPLKQHTIDKDWTCLRRIGRTAMDDGWISKMWVMPRKDEKSKANPRPWLEEDEFETVLRVARERADEATDPELKARREELIDYIELQVYAGSRVDEVRAIRLRDVTIKQEKLPENTMLYKMKGAKQVPVHPRRYLSIRVKGKTGIRTNTTRPGAVAPFQRLVRRNHLKPDDFIFVEHRVSIGPKGQVKVARAMVDELRDLFIAAGVEQRQGQDRNAKSLRCTALMKWVKSNPSINLKMLAENCGTSVNTLANFYLKPLTAELNPEELLRGD